MFFQIVDYRSLTEKMDQKHANWLPAVHTFAEICNISLTNCPPIDLSVINIKEEVVEKEVTTPAMPSLAPYTPRRKRIANLNESTSDEDFNPEGIDRVSTSTPRTLRKRPAPSPLKDTQHDVSSDVHDDVPLDDSDKDSDYEIEEVHVSNDDDDDDDDDAVTEISLNQSRQSNASNWQFTGGPKQKLAARGMYEKIPDTDPFLQGLKRYMRVEQNVVSDRHINNTASNVGRMFYFLQRGKHRNIQLDPSALLKKDLITEWKEIYQSSNAGASPVLNMGKSLTM